MTEGFQNAAQCWDAIREDFDGNRGLLPLIEKYARENTAPSKIVFGTSGWRGEIGTDYTFNSIRIVTSAIIQMFRESSPDVLKAMGVADFNDIKNRGVIVGHDNRFLGPQFADAVMGLLINSGIRTWYAGEAVTPEFSVGIEMMNAACSINLTPSHNPANYGGFKFNPSDGGPAGPEITKRIEDIANELMSESLVVEPVPARQIERIDLTSLRSSSSIPSSSVRGAAASMIERVIFSLPNLILASPWVTSVSINSSLDICSRLVVRTSSTR